MDSMKGVSPIISAVILIVVAIAISTLVGPWMYNLARTSTNETATSTITDIRCRNAGIDFDSDYATYGVDWNFTTLSDWLKVKAENTGTINLHNFSFELTINNSNILQYDVKNDSQRSLSNPLKPGQAAILEANITANISGTLNRVKLRNEVCKNVYVNQKV